MSKFFLGFDSSTQSLTAIIIDFDAREVVYERSVNFDESLPHYGTKHGVLPSDDPKVAHAPPLMWAEGLDRLCEIMRRDKAPLGEIRSISGSGQQHGTVYLNKRAAAALAGLDTAENLADALRDVFSRPTSPVWMDSSTTTECDEIRKTLGGAKVTAETTGSDTFERFSGPQIRKFHKENPDGYESARHIALVSSFMSSLLAGRISPIDHGDGAGMNLMDIKKKEWLPKALEATAPDLSERLPHPCVPWTIVGDASPYFARRYGLNRSAKCVAWSGDNPCSVIGLGLIDSGMVAISLGTSDTYFGTMNQCRTDPRSEGHVFGSPTGDYMTLICFKNGSLAREKIRDMYGMDWNQFSDALRQTPPGNNGKVLLPYFEPEIVPKVLKPGPHRFSLQKQDATGNCRAVVEAQMLSTRIHSEWMRVRPRQIYATGSASVNREILQVMADVHQCPVYRFDVSNSAALGAALRAAHGYFSHIGDAVPWGEIVRGFTEPTRGSRIDPNPDTLPIYDKLVRQYAALEAEVARELA
jgi:xylulokinase